MKSADRGGRFFGTHLPDDRQHTSWAHLALSLAVLLASGGLVLGARSATAQEDDVEDLMGGFDEEFDVGELESTENETPAWLAALPYGKEFDEAVDLSGSLATGLVWNYLSHTNADGRGGTTDYGGLSRLDLDGFLQLDIRLPFEWQARAELLAWYDFAYHIQGRDDYSTAVLDVYEWQVDSGEAYVTGPLHDNIDLTIGRKVVNWGRSDTFRVVDVVNPLDNKEPGLVDIEDLRRPKAMVKIDVSSGPWSGQFLVIPEHRYDRLPPIGSDFIPDVFAGQGLGGNSRISDRSDFSGTPGLAGKVDGRFSGWDFSVYGAYTDEGTRVISLNSVGQIEAEANRFGLLGVAGNITRGAFLFKTEFAWLSNLRVLRFDLPPLPVQNLLTVERDRLDTMVGIEYYGPDSLTIALEIVNRHLLDHPGGPPGRREFTAQDNFETGLRISRPFFRERLDVTVLGIVLGEKMQDGGIFRASADFELTDSWKLEGGWLVFFGGPRRGLGAFDSNDRVYGEIKYSF